MCHKTQLTNENNTITFPLIYHSWKIVKEMIVQWLVRFNLTQKKNLLTFNDAVVITIYDTVMQNKLQILSEIDNLKPFAMSFGSQQRQINS